MLLIAAARDAPVASIAHRVTLTLTYLVTYLFVSVVFTCLRHVSSVTVRTVNEDLIDYVYSTCGCKAVHWSDSSSSSSRRR